jgi:hypothetical protein
MRTEYECDEGHARVKWLSDSKKPACPFCHKEVAQKKERVNDK